MGLLKIGTNLVFRIVDKTDELYYLYNGYADVTDIIATWYCNNNPLIYSDPDEAHEGAKAAIDQLSFVIGGAFTDAGQAAAGYTFAGDKLSPSGRGMHLMGAILPFVNGAEIRGTSRLANKIIEGGSDKVLGGSFKKVNATRGADEVGHHIAQDAYNKTIGISRNDGPAVLMTKEDHLLTRTYAGKGRMTMINDVEYSARERMYLDIVDSIQNRKKGIMNMNLPNLYKSIENRVLDGHFVLMEK